jgi:hypothetical protein
MRAGNRTLTVMDQIRGIDPGWIGRDRRTAQRGQAWPPPCDVAHAVREHRDVSRRHDDPSRIYQAIIAQEPWRAEMPMREHVSSVKASLIRSLTEHTTDQTSPPACIMIR